VEFETLYQRVEDETSEGAASSFEASMSAISGRDVSSNLPDVDFYSGRQLSEEDAGQRRIVVPANSLTLAADIETGDLLTFNLTQPNTQTTRTVTFEIIGMEDQRQSTITVSFGASNYAPIGAFPEGIEPSVISAIVDVDEAQVSALKDSMNELSGVFVLETRLLNDLVNRFIERFTSFPILVAALALFTGGVVIANSVALTTLERRREIGIMKAVGLQRERVLAMLLLEYGVLGLIGGLIGVGISIVILILLLNTLFGGDLVEVIPYPTALALMAACVGIALLAAITTAWGASGEKPLNVLRYEQ
jgi:putative ABC transport system permease protein